MVKVDYQKVGDNQIKEIRDGSTVLKSYGDRKERDKVFKSYFPTKKKNGGKKK